MGNHNVNWRVNWRHREPSLLELARDRGVAVKQAALDLARERVAQWVKEIVADPQHAFPGKGQMKPEQHEIERLRPPVESTAAYFAKESV